MMVILGLDGLEYEYVKEFNCKNLMQEKFGKTDISMFSEPRTIVIWSSFLAGKNLEKEILGKDEEVLEEIITRSVRIKGEIVEKDEKEKGLRAILNFGHTLGHAIEYASRFKIWHGEAVSLGMIGALYISWQMGITGKENLERLERILKIYELPTRWKGKDYEALYPLLLKDKKRKEGKIKFVLLRNIGETEIRDDVPEELIRETLYYLQK